MAFSNLRPSFQESSVLAVFSVVCCGVTALGAAEVSEKEFYQDLRGAAPHIALDVFGAGAKEAARPERAGLRIRTAAEPDKQGRVGVSPKFAIRGDFEVTLTYQILKADEAPGVNGVNVRVAVGDPAREAADLARYVMPGGRQVYFANRVSPGAERREPAIKTFPTSVKTGKLRIARKGTQLHYLVAEGASDQFKEIHQSEFVADDCDVNFVAFTGKGPATLDVRFLEVRIKADELPGVPLEPAGWGWVVWVILGVAAVALALGAAAGGFAVWRRRKK